MENNDILRASTIVSNMDQMMIPESDLEEVIRYRISSDMAKKIIPQLQLNAERLHNIDGTRYSVEVGIISVEELRELREYKRIFEENAGTRAYKPWFQDIITK